jgi:hypothetical protein
MLFSSLLLSFDSERKAYGEQNCEHTKDEKYEIAANKKKLKKHQKEMKAIKMKITSISVQYMVS